MLGIGQAEDSIGFERLLLTPTPAGDLAEASGYFDSPRGRIAVAWKKSSATFTLDLTIPGNTDATLVLPVPAGAVLTESGKPLAEAPGITGVTLENGPPAVSLGAGTYHIVCESPATPPE